MNPCEKGSNTSVPLFISNGKNVESIAIQAKIAISLIEDFGKDLCVPFYKVALIRLSCCCM